jgi:hypothetical protein
MDARTGKGLISSFISHSLPDFLKGRVSITPFNLHIYATDGKGWTLLPLLAIRTLLMFWLRSSIGGPNDRDGLARDQRGKVIL